MKMNTGGLSGPAVLPIAVRMVWEVSNAVGIPVMGMGEMCIRDSYGRGAIVNSSRGIMCAWQKTGKDGVDYAEAARASALAMRDDIRSVTPVL